MSKVETTPQDKQSKLPTNKPVQAEMFGLETAVVNPIPSLQRTYDDPGSLTSADVQTLQRTIGNQALGRLIIQRKMTVGPVGDKYEQEADAVAKQVVSTLHATSAQTAPTQTAQRQEEEEELQMKPLIQRQEEEELQMKSIQRQEEEDELQMKPLPSISSLQRQEEEELQMKPVQRQEKEELGPMLAGGELSGDVESSVQRAKSGGTPLADTVRQPMENAFNADFSGVKVHTDGLADNLNRSLSARAFTNGNDIFFREGEYNPNSSGGQELLAHELTHTIQQGSATSLQRNPALTPKQNNRLFVQRNVVGGLRRAVIQRKIGHHAKLGEAVYNEELWSGRVDGKIEKINHSDRDPLLNTRIPKLGFNIRIPNPLPKLVGSMQKGHSKIAKAVDSYDIRGDDGQMYEGVKPEGRGDSADEAWNLVSRDERLASAGPSMMDKAGQMVQGGQALAAGRDADYEELGGGGMMAVAKTYGSQLLPVFTDLTEILQGRIDAQSTRHASAVASKAGSAAVIAGAIVTASKAIEKAGDVLDKLDLAVEVTPVVGQIYQAIKLAAKIVKQIAKIYITYKSLQDEGTRILLSFSEQVAASGAIEAIKSLSSDLAEDENLTEATRERVLAALTQAVVHIEAGVSKYDELEQQVRSAVA